jgi:hypothetical protein
MRQVCWEAIYDTVAQRTSRLPGRRGRRVEEWWVSPIRDVDVLSLTNLISSVPNPNCIPLNLSAILLRT